MRCCDEMKCTKLQSQDIFSLFSQWELAKEKQKSENRKIIYYNLLSINITNKQMF